MKKKSTTNILAKIFKKTQAKKTRSKVIIKIIKKNKVKKTKKSVSSKNIKIKKNISITKKKSSSNSEAFIRVRSSRANNFFSHLVSMEPLYLFTVRF